MRPTRQLRSLRSIQFDQTLSCEHQVRIMLRRIIAPDALKTHRRAAAMAVVRSGPSRRCGVARRTMAGDTTVPCTTKSPPLAKRRRWGVVMRVHPPSDAWLLCRDDDGRRKPSDVRQRGAAAMVGSRKSRGTVRRCLVLESKKAQRTDARTQVRVRRAIDDAIV